MGSHFHTSLVVPLVLLVTTACAGSAPQQPPGPDEAQEPAQGPIQGPTRPQPLPQDVVVPLPPTGGKVPAPLAAVKGSSAQPGSGAFTFIGRFDARDPQKARFAWPNSAVEANFTGSKLTLLMAEEAPTQYSGAPVNNAYDVIIDQGKPTVVKTNNASTKYPVAQGLDDGYHTVIIAKRTESSMGTGQFLGLELAPEGKFLSPPNKFSHTIEFIGDSAATGYGADNPASSQPTCKFSDATQNADVSYPRYLATALGANLVNLSYSGKGVSRNLSPEDPVKTLPYMYPRIVPDQDSAPYDFGQYTADAVVVEAGGNDFVGFGNNTTPPNPDVFVAAYADFLKQIRSRNPNAQVFAVLRPRPNEKDNVILRNMLTAAMTQVADANVTFIALPLYDPAWGYACDYHPSPTGAREIAKALADKMMPELNWN